MTLRHLLLLPTSSCPAACSYCFGPRTPSSVMSSPTVRAVVAWLNARPEKGPLEIIFHGGEPLLVGAAFYREALAVLGEGLAPRPVRFALQSNLWFLNDELCELFREYDVGLGTSLDGPEPINDEQRGAGSFVRTLQGVERARRHGLRVGAICTFTRQSAYRVSEVFRFFSEYGLDFSIHPAVPIKAGTSDNWVLSPGAYGDVILTLLEEYLSHPHPIRVRTLDTLCRSIATKRAGMCTFGECLGEYAAIAPNGDIYTCQRLVGGHEYRLGNIMDPISNGDESSRGIPPALTAWQSGVQRECAECPHWLYCHGGCPFNALVASAGGADSVGRDPYCPAYKRAFDTILDRATAEVFSVPNLASVIAEGTGKRGLLHKGRLLELMNES